MIETNKIYNMDCLDLMKKLPDNYFDLIITDPPYGIKRDKLTMGANNLTKKIDYGDYKWDNHIPTEEHFKQMFRVSKNQIIFGGNYMTIYLKPSSGWIVWDKDNTGDFADCELAWTSFDSAVRKFKWRWNGMIQENKGIKDKRYHPTQKPVALGRWLLNKFATKGDKIFDPFAGSGSFLIACKQLGYDFVGCEIEECYFNVIMKRLKQKTVSDFNLQKEESLIRAKSQLIPSELTLDSTSRALRGV